MATRFELQAIITALDNASKVFGKVASSAKKSGSGIKTAFKGAGNIFGGMRKGVKGVDNSLQKMGQQLPAIQAAFGGLKAAMDLGKLGASFERVEERFGKFAEAAGGADAIFEAFQKGVGGTASKMDAMSISSGLLQAGLVGSAAEMERVTEVASRLGNQTIGVADRIGEFSQLLKNQSIQLLDNFGISSGRVRERIKELQAQTKGLSREQAFLTATFEQADAALAVLGPRTEDSLTKFEKMDAQMADLRVEIGQKLAPAMAELMGGFSEGLSIVSSLIDVFAGLGDSVAGLISSVPVLGDAFDSSLGKLDVAAAAETAKQLAILSDGSKVAEGTISEWGAAAQAAMEQGSSLGDEMLNMAARTKEVSEAFDEGGAIADIFVDQTGILTEASKAAGDVAIATAKDYDEYADSVASFNAVVPDATAKIEALTQAQFNMAKITLEGASANSLLADSILQNKLVRHEQLVGIEAVNTAVKDSVPEWLSANRVQQGFSELQQVGTQRMQEREQALGSLNQSTEASGAIMALATARQEHLAGSAERAASSTARLAEQQRAASEATAAFAVEQGNLMVQLTGATEAQFKQAVFAEIDPAELGVEAYAALGVELGVLDEKSAGLAAAVPLLISAYNEGIIPTENMAEATTALFEAAGDANTNVAAVLDEFARAPGLIGPSRDELETLNERLVLVGEESVTAAGSITGFDDSVSDVAATTATAAGEIDVLTESLTELTAQPWVVDVTVNQSGGADVGIPQFQAGGVMPFTGLAHLERGEIVLPPGQGTVTKNFNLTVNTAAPLEPILQDFATLEAMG